MADQTVQALRARWSDFPALSLVHTEAFFGRGWRDGLTSRIFLKLFVTPWSGVTLLPSLWAGEMYRIGTDTMVTMSGPATRGRRLLGRGIMTVALFVLELTVAVLVIVLVLGAARMPEWRAGAMVVVGLLAVAVVGVLIGVVPVLKAVSGRRRRDAGIRDIRARFPDRRWWVLANLARGRAAPTGTGIALLKEMLAAPQHAGGMVIAAAAAERLVDLYVDAGMTRVSDDSLVVYRMT